MSQWCVRLESDLHPVTDHLFQYLVARLISGFAVGLGTGIMTTYYSELALPTRRGLLGGLHGLGIELGALVCGWIALGCYYSSNSSFAWRFPVSLICLLALVLLIVSFFLPETPRWLIRHGRADEALHVLEALHHTPNDPNIGHREFQQIEMQLREEQVQFQTYGKWQLFTDRHYLTRLFRACGLVLFIQSNGILLIYNYSSIIYSTLGLGPSQALALLAGWISWTAVCIYTGNMLSDKFSRKKVIMAGFVGCCTFLSIYMAALSQYLETGATKWAAVSVVFIFLDVIPFGACLANNCFTVPTELFPNHLRTWAACIAISCTYLIQVLWLNVGPLALTNVSWKFYSVFIACGFCGIFYVFFFIPNVSLHLAFAPLTAGSSEN
jgi:MFS family permease